MEDYVDDILKKSIKREDHFTKLAKLFDRLKQYNLRLNPKKCVFKVTSGKPLGYIVSRRVIEVDPTKVKSILEIPPLKTLKQLTSLQGKIQSISRFIMQPVDKCHSFTHLLHKDITFKWDGRCDRAFQQVKEYLLTPLVIMPPIPDKEMILYVSTTQATLGALLAQLDDNNKERVVYYISQTLVGYELEYSPIETMSLSIIFSTQNLRHYILNRQVNLISKVDPLKYLLAKQL